MEQRKKLLEERERLKTEHAKRTKIWMDAFNKRDGLLPGFHDTPDGVMATLVLTTEYAEYDKAAEEEREAFAKLRATEEKIGEINTKLQS